MPSFPFDLAGPRFLAFYAVFSVAAIGAFILLRRLLESGGAPRLDLADPYLMACLRGGPREAIRVAVLALAGRGLVEHRGGKLRAKKGADRTPAGPPLEAAVLASLGDRERTPLFFQHEPDLVQKAGEYEMRLVEKGLLPSHAVRTVRAAVASVAVLVIGGTAAAKVVIGLSRGRPVSFLVILAVAACWAAWWLVTRPPRTARGDAVLSDARTLYRRLRARAAYLAPESLGGDAALLAAVYGAGALQGGDWKPIVSATAPPRAFPSGGSSSCSSWFSCGSSGVSSCGSSCGSSSCGGGGGCGGCGGS